MRKYVFAFEYEQPCKNRAYRQRSHDYQSVCRINAFCDHIGTSGYHRVISDRPVGADKDGENDQSENDHNAQDRFQDQRQHQLQKGERNGSCNRQGDTDQQENTGVLDFECIRLENIALQKYTEVSAGKQNKNTDDAIGQQIINQHTCYRPNAFTEPPEAPFPGTQQDLLTISGKIFKRVITDNEYDHKIIKDPKHIRFRMEKHRSPQHPKQKIPKAQRSTSGLMDKFHHRKILKTDKGNDCAGNGILFPLPDHSVTKIIPHMMPE